MPCTSPNLRYIPAALTFLPSVPAPPYPLQVPGLGLRIDTTRLDLTYKSKYDAHLPGEAHTHAWAGLGCVVRLA